MEWEKSRNLSAAARLAPCLLLQGGDDVMWNKDDTRPIRARTKDGGRVVELNYPISMLAAIKKVHGLHPYSFIPLRSGGRLYLGDLDGESFDELNKD